MEIYFGKMISAVKLQGRFIPGHRWWKRHQDKLLYGKGMTMSHFQVCVSLDLRGCCTRWIDLSNSSYLSALNSYPQTGLYR